MIRMFSVSMTSHVVIKDLSRGWLQFACGKGGGEAFKEGTFPLQDA